MYYFVERGYMYEENLLFKISWYYYFENMTQQSISEKLGISRMNVIKLLNKAKSQGIVQFKIKTDVAKRMELEGVLMEKYNLENVFVIPSSFTDTNESIAIAAAQYIQSHIAPNCYINVGYGDTVSRVIRHLINYLDSHVSLVSLTGGVSYYISSIIAGAHKSDYAGQTPGIFLIPSPLIASTPEIAREFLSDESVKTIIDMNKLASLSIVGVGAVTESATIFRDNKINRNEITLLKMRGAVGDILCQYFDKDGNAIDYDLHQRLVTTPLDVLKQYKNVIGVAAGRSKLEALHAALIGQYLDVLITDEDTAQQLSQMDGAVNL